MNLLMAIVWAIMPYCATEDSHYCKWDATVQGNGIGTSFFDIAGFAFVEITE